jgi:hypothetical protein
MELFDQVLFSLLICIFIIIDLVDEILIDPCIVSIIESYALCRLLVSTSSSHLLNELIKRLWHVVVNDKSNISFVYTHSKCYGCHDNLNFLFHPIILHKFPLFFVKACTTIDYSRLIFVPVNSIDQQRNLFCLFFWLLFNFYCDIWAVK